MQSSPQEMTGNNKQDSTTAEADSMSAIDVSSIALAAKLQEMQNCREVIQQRAAFMKAHGNIVTLEGRVGGRGSEYNLVLGDKCGSMVRKSLQVMSIWDGQIKIGSL